jgi:hypothetical protein
MSKLKTYSEFINESIIDAVKNPIKWKKIKNNAKKFQKAKVAHALNGVDYAKKLASSDTKKETAVLKATNAVKNDSLKDIQSNIGTRMDDLATTAGLKAVVKLAKTTSSLAANKIIIKAATGEQAKQLKIKQKELVGKVSAAKNALKDYESTDTEKPKAKTDTSPTEDAPQETKKKSIAEEKKAAAKQKIGNKISDAMEAIGKAKEERVLAQKEEDDLEKEKDAAIGTPEENRLMKAVAAADKAGKDIEAGIEKLRGNIKDLQKQHKALDESVDIVEEGMYTASQLTDMLLDDIRRGDRKGTHAPDEKELKELAKKRLKMNRLMKADIQDTIDDWDSSLAAARKDKHREFLGKIPESVNESHIPLVESISDKFKRLSPNL